jgi:hypothetical protein
VEFTMGADDLGLIQLEGVGGGIGDDHGLDGEGGIIDVALGDVGIADIDAGE